MTNHDTQPPATCPAPLAALSQQTRQAVDDLLQWCLTFEGTFWQFEQQLFVLLAALGCAVTRLFLAARHQRLDLTPYLQDDQYRRGDAAAPGSLKTAYGVVAYVRVHLIRRAGGAGFYPLDAALGLTRDQLSPRVMQFVGRLATRMSFAASRLICQAALGWFARHRDDRASRSGVGPTGCPLHAAIAAAGQRR